MTTDREYRHIKINAFLTDERGEGYALAFRAAIAAVCRFAAEQAGIRGLTKDTALSLKNCVAELIGKARHDASEDAITYALAEELRAHAIAEMEETIGRLGMRGAK